MVTNVRVTNVLVKKGGHKRPGHKRPDHKRHGHKRLGQKLPATIFLCYPLLWARMLIRHKTSYDATFEKSFEIRFIAAA